MASSKMIAPLGLSRRAIKTGTSWGSFSQGTGRDSDPTAPVPFKRQYQIGPLAGRCTTVGLDSVGGVACCLGLRGLWDRFSVVLLGGGHFWTDSGPHAWQDCHHSAAD